MSTAFLRYRDQLTGCLMTYQFIEEGLRFCLIRYHATVKFRLDGFLPYELPLQSIEDAALGRLIDWYKVYAKNTELIRELRRIKSMRDHVAHQGLALTLEEQMNESLLDEKTKELEEAYAKANACFLQLVREMEAAEESVSRAYDQLKAERDAQALPVPEPFVDPIPSPGAA
jgi:hypothetical protein